MKPILFPPIYISMFVLLLSAVLAVASLSDSILNIITSFLFWSCLYGVGLVCGYQNAIAKNPRYANIMNGVLIFGLIIFVISISTQELIVALSLLLMWMQAAKNFTLSTRRDLYFGFGLSFFLLMYAAANAKSSGFLFYMIMYVLAGTFALVATHLDKRATEAEDYGSKIEKKSLNFFHSVAVLSVAIIGLAALLYLFVPRPAALNYGAFAAAGGMYYENDEWEKQAKNSKSLDSEFSERAVDDAVRANNSDDSSSGVAGQGFGGKQASQESTNGSGAGAGQEKGQSDDFSYRGFEQSFDIGNAGEGQLRNDLLLYVDASRPMYLRGAVFDTFENNKWSKSLTETRKLKLKFGEIQFGDQSDELELQTITLKENIVSTIFAAEEIKNLNFPGSVIAQDRYGALYAPSVMRKGTVYSVKSYMPVIQGRLITGSKIPIEKNHYLQIPDNLSTKIDKLSKDVSRTASDDLSRAMAIERYLRNEFEYTFDTVLSPDNRLSIDTFLFETRRGHCELFATSMVMMLRSLGIPARLATGFSATNMNPITGYYEVRGLDAHAWVEAYISDYGWVLFEPTAFYNLPQESPPSTTAEALQKYLENLTRGAEISDPDSLDTLSLASLLALFNQLGELFDLLWEGIKSISTVAWNLVLQNSLLLSLVVLLTVLAIYGFRLIKHPLFTHLALLRLKTNVKGNPDNFMKLCYEEFENYFARKGLAKKHGWTTQEYEQMLVTSYKPLDKYISEITTLFNRVCYSEYQTSSADAQAALAGFKEIVDYEKRK
ncbi:MAG: DUF3488 domain-containing transglutaminase family protein [Gammaproteobacteria bacterium]|nr:DUF3488 domain-containing transglutaminase family protein [Gammaproteobacteria bacterium]